MIMGGILLNYLVGGALLRPVQSNHVPHVVAFAKAERQKTLAKRHHRKSSSSNPDVVYESDISTQDDKLTDKVRDVIIPKLMNIEASILSAKISKVLSSVVSNTNDSTSNVRTNTATSNITTKNISNATGSTMSCYSKETSLLLRSTNDKHKSKVIYSSITAFSASTKSTAMEHQNGIGQTKESFTSLVQQHTTKIIALICRKFKIITSLPYVLYSGQNLVLQFCTAVPLIFLPQLGVENGYTETASSILISVSGIFNIVGRFLFGFVFDMQCTVRRRRLCHALFGLSLGTAVICLGLTDNYATMCLGAAFHGTTTGGYHAQKTSIAAEFVPIILMPDAVGFSFFFEGFGSLVAAPLFGLVVDQYSTYRYGFFGCSAIFIFFTVLVLAEYCKTNIFNTPCHKE